MLIGREHEQQVIERLVAAARIGDSGVLAVTGEPGVGKSTLLRWAERQLDGFRVLSVTGTEPEHEVPFGGLLSVLRPTLGLLDTLAAPQARALAAALALGDGDTEDRFAIGAATLSLLCRYAEEAPAAVILDDVPLIDRPSADALLFAARRLGADRMAVLVAGREGEADDLLDGLDRLVVRGLSLGAARTLVEAVSESPVTDDWIHRVHGLTGGNPLAIAELAKDPDALAPTGPDIPLPLSAALTESFTRRLRQLDAAARSVLLVAVVCNGDLLLTGAACAALGLDPAQLSAAQRAGFAHTVGGEITFRHPLLRAAIYSDSPAGEQRRVHSAVAGAIPENDVDRRAWHLSEALWAPDADVADLLEAAAVRARARAAHSVASGAYERAARLTPGLAEASRRLLEAAETAWAAGLGHRALSLLDELSRRPLDQDAAMRARELRAVIAVRSGSLREGSALLEAAAAATASADRRALLLAEAVHATFFLVDGAAAARLASQLAKAVDATTSQTARAVGTLATGMAKVLAGHGGTDDLRAAVPLLADAPDLQADGYGMSWLMYAPLFIRDADTGRELRGRVDAAREGAGVGALPRLLFLVARDGATTDAWARAAADYTESIRLARDTGQTTELAMSLAGLSWLESRTGQQTECRAHAAEAIALARDRDIHWAEAWALLSLGDLSLVSGDAAAAADVLGQADELLLGLGAADPDLSSRPELVSALVRLGRPDEAEPLAAEFLAAADLKGQPWACARARRGRGLLAVEDFNAPFLEALLLHEDTLDLFETARTELAYGERLRRAGRRVESREHLRRAFTMFSGLGAEPWTHRAAAELDLTGEHVPRRPITGVAALTPQELQVALLLADGRTTREAAAALFLSPKTVEYHLRKVYLKLGVRSRVALAESVSPELHR